MLAANALLLNFQTFMAYRARRLRARGRSARRRGDRARATGTRSAQAVKVTMLWSALGAAGFSLVYWAAGPWIVERLTDQAAVRAAALQRICRGRRCSPVVSVAGFQLDGVFIGATRTRELMKAMAVSSAVFLRGAWALAGPLGNHGLWLALTIFMVARGVTLIVQLPAIERAVTSA